MYKYSRVGYYAEHVKWNGLKNIWQGYISNQIQKVTAIKCISFKIAQIVIHHKKSKLRLWVFFSLSEFRTWQLNSWNII